MGRQIMAHDIAFLIAWIVVIALIYYTRKDK